MMKRIRHISIGLIVAGFAVSAGIAAAVPSQSASEFGHARQNQLNWQSQRPNVERSLYVQKQSQRKISASRAKSAAMSRYRNTKFINVQLINQSTYRVRLQQKNGRIVDVYVDAYTGRVKN
jgi:uncharacterized membrane protein YkoI